MYDKLYFKANKEAERRKSEMDPGVPWVVPSIDPSRAVPDLSSVSDGFMVRPDQEEATGYEDDDFMTRAFMALSGERAKTNRAKKTVSESSVKGTTSGAKLEQMDEGAMEAMNSLSQSYPNLRITSSYRSPKKNAAVGGAKHSQHMHGKAFDLDVSHIDQEERIQLIRQARKSGFSGIGVYKNSLHFDTGPTRAWGPSYGSESLPSWAHEAVYGEL